MIFAQWPLGERFLAGTTTGADYRQPDQQRALVQLFPRARGAGWLQQVHGARVLTPAQYETENRPDRCPEADAFFCDRADWLAVVLTADCVPVLLASENHWAAVHAGWKGLHQNLIAATVAHFPAGAEIHAWLGPHIRQPSYEVDEAFRAHFPDYPEAFTPNRPGHHLADLTAIARRQLSAAGVASVSDCAIDTFSDPRCHSYRRDRERFGLHATFIFPLSKD